MNVDAAHYYGVFECDRCGKCYDQDYGLRERLFVYRYLFWRWYYERVGSWRNWLKCSDCGRRFGRHDESQDHLPF